MEQLLEWNQFDQNLPDSSDDSDSDSDSGSDSDTEDSDLEDKYVKHQSKSTYKRRKTSSSSDEDEGTSRSHHKSQHKSKQVKTKDNKINPETKKTGKSTNKSTNDVEDLIEQLGKLSLSDPKYGLLYYRALKIDSAVEKCIPPPRMVGRVSVSNIHSSQNLSMPLTKDIRRTPNCFACGSSNHAIRECPEIQKLIKNGIIIRNEQQRLILKNGSRITRLPNETLIQAIHRLSLPKSHFLAVAGEDADEEIYVHYYQSETETEDNIYPAWNVERATRSTNVTRKEEIGRAHV